MAVGWLAAATAASGALSAGSSLLGSGKSSSASKEASAEQLAMYEQTRSDLSPYTAAGTGVLSDLTAAAKAQPSTNYLAKAQSVMPPSVMTESALQQTPGYQFQLNQGQQALQNSQAAQNGVLSGAALKSLVNYNQDYASTGYQNAYNRWLNTYNADQNAYQNGYNRWLSSQQNAYGQLHDMASLGQNSAAQVGNTGASYASSQANLMSNMGSAQAAGTVGSANAINSALSNGTGYYMLNGMLNRGGGSGGTPTDANGYALSNYASGGSASGVTPYL